MSQSTNPGALVFSKGTLGNSNNAGLTEGDYLTILKTGNLGIASSTPWASLSVHAAAGTNSFAIGSSTATYFLVNSSGNVGIGTAAPSHKVVVNDPAGAWINFEIGGSDRGFIGANTEGGNALRMSYNGGANQGIFIDSSDNTDVKGLLYNNGITAGTGSYYACVSSTWYLQFQTSCTGSSRSIKHDIEDLGGALDEVMQLRPVSFVYNTGYSSDQTTHLGFIAEEVAELDPRIAVFNASGTPESVQYQNITALLAGAIQDLNLKLEDLATTTQEIDEHSFTGRFFSSLFTRITQWFADATNGIQDFFARRGHFEELCVGDTCVTPDQFAEVFGSQSAAAGASGSGVAPEAPDGSSSSGGPAADTATTTTPTSDIQQDAEDRVEEPAAANDNQPGAGDAAEPEPDAFAEEEDAVEEPPAPEPQAANGNPAAEMQEAI